MNQDQIKGQWMKIEGEARRLFGKLTDDDWKVAAGDLEKLAGRIQARYGDAKETVRERLLKIVAGVESASTTVTHWTKEKLEKKSTP